MMTEFVAECKALREQIELTKIDVRKLKLQDSIDKLSQINEMRKNAELCFRHLEDARMRLGKAIQASTEDGKSIYDKE